MQYVPIGKEVQCPRPTALRRNVEPDQGVVLVDDLLRCVEVADFICDPLNLIVEDVREALEEDQGEDVVLELWSVERSPNLARCVPEPHFKGLHIERAVAICRGSG